MDFGLVLWRFRHIGSGRSQFEFCGFECEPLLGLCIISAQYISGNRFDDKTDDICGLPGHAPIRRAVAIQ